MFVPRSSNLKYSAIAPPPPADRGAESHCSAHPVRALLPLGGRARVGTVRASSDGPEGRRTLDHAAPGRFSGRYAQGSGAATRMARSPGRVATPRRARCRPWKLHLDVARRIERELARLERRRRAVAAGRELDDDRLVALDQRVDQELVGAGREVEVLERIDVERDRDRGEVGRDVGLVDDDPLDPAGAVRRDLAPAQVAVRDGLLQERPQEVEHVLAARHHAMVHEELGRRLHGAGSSVRGHSGREGTRRDGSAGAWARVRRVGRFGPRMIRPCCSRSTSATRTSRSARSGTGSLTAVRRAATPRSATPDELEVLLEDLLRLDDAAFADVSAISCASVVPAITATLEGVAARRERPLLVAGAGTVPIPIRTDRPGDVGRRPAGQRARGGAPVRHAGDRDRPRDGDDVRLRRGRRRVRRRGDRAGHRAGAGCPGVAHGQAAPGGAADAGPGDRARHGLGHPERRRPRLPVAGRWAARQDPARARGRLRRAPGRRARDPDRRPVGDDVGERAGGRRGDRPEPDAQGPRDPARGGRGRAAAPLELRDVARAGPEPSAGRRRRPGGSRVA